VGRICSRSNHAYSYHASVFRGDLPCSFYPNTVNKNTESLEDVEEDIEDIQEDVQGLEKDVEEIQTDVESLEENVEDITEDLETPTPSTPPTGILHTLNQIEQQLTDITKNLAKLRSEMETLKKE